MAKNPLAKSLRDAIDAQGVVIVDALKEILRAAPTQAYDCILSVDRLPLPPEYGFAPINETTLRSFLHIGTKSVGTPRTFTDVTCAVSLTLLAETIKRGDSSPQTAMFQQLRAALTDERRTRFDAALDAFRATLAARIPDAFSAAWPSAPAAAPTAFPMLDANCACLGDTRITAAMRTLFFKDDDQQAAFFCYRINPNAPHRIVRSIMIVSKPACPGAPPSFYNYYYDTSVKPARSRIAVGYCSRIGKTLSFIGAAEQGTAAKSLHFRCDFADAIECGFNGTVCTEQDNDRIVADIYMLRTESKAVWTLMRDSKKIPVVTAIPRRMYQTDDKTIESATEKEDLKDQKRIIDELNKHISKHKIIDHLAAEVDYAQALMQIKYDTTVLRGYGHFITGNSLSDLPTQDDNIFMNLNQRRAGATIF